MPTCLRCPTQRRRSQKISSPWLHAQFSEPELVELGFFIALTMGQQRWLRTLNIDHHQIMPGSSAGMASGLEDAERLENTKTSKDYWAKDKLA